MTPNSLTLKGFRGIRDGLGRDELSIDLDSIVGNARLVAISGGNGAGKTTVMDNLHPYLVMPSRAGADGLGRFSYYDHVVLPENVKDLIWTHSGTRYRSEVVIRVNGKKKTEAYLYIDNHGTWIPYRMQDGTASDGKVDTYTRAVEEICGSRETFFTSQFSAQGKRQLSAYDPAEIKSLMADLLGHEIIRTTGQQGAKVIDLVKIGLTGQRQALAALETEQTTIAQALAELGDPDVALATLANEKVIAQSVVQRATEDRARVLADSEAAAQNDTRRQQLANERAALINEGREAVNRIDVQYGREAAQKQDLNTRIANRLAACRTAITQVEGRMATLQKTIAGGAKVAWAKRRLPQAEAVVAGREAQSAHIRQTVSGLSEFTQEQKSGRERLVAIEREAGKAILRAEELARRFGLTDEVPCAGTNMQGECKLLSDAMDAKPLLPSAKAETARLADERIAVQSGIDAAGQALGNALRAMGAVDLVGAQARIRQADRRIESARGRVSKLAVLAARETDIAQAKADLSALEAELAAVAAQPEGETPEETTQRTAFETMLTDLTGQRATLAGQYRQRLDATDAAIAELPAPFDTGRLKSAEAAVTAAAAEVARIETDYTAALRAQQAASGYAVRLSELDNKLTVQRAQVAEIEQKLSYWVMFGKCMSNDGVIALAIDDAGPTLAAYTNDLLLACYGPRFSVSIVTQSTTAKGETREDFDIIVHDGSSGDSKSVTLMSGGERVWINECLVRAIALYLAQSKGRSCDTLFSDETDGPLDPERKRAFMAMKLEVLRLGGYSREYFVSQTHELTAMADAVINVESFRV